MTSLKMKKGICKNQQRNGFSCGPTSITTCSSTIMWCSAGLCQTKWAGTAQGRNHFWASLVLGLREQGESFPSETQTGILLNTEMLLWHKSRFSHSGGPADWNNQSMADSGTRGKSGENVTHPFQRGRLDKEINSLALAQGNGLFCWLQFAVLCRGEGAARVQSPPEAFPGSAWWGQNICPQIQQGLHSPWWNLCDPP